jgi:asparagine synthase (glutamine-hydrolysing)
MEGPPIRLGKALAALAHRGPDDKGVYHDAAAGISLAHARLSIIDLSAAGRQPMASLDGSLVIVFNGEIYNFRELRAMLEREGFTFRGHSDTEVLLTLYQARGDALLPLLNGIFAFAIFDYRERRLLLATDALGVKPLYYAGTPGSFTFASELKALIELPGVTPELDIGAIYRYLGFLWSPGGSTPFKDVVRMGPGEALEIRLGRAQRRWQWADTRWDGQPVERDMSTAVCAVESSLRTAVRRQMVSDVPVGAFLSGGLDSSAVVAMAREIDSEIDCFTIDTGGVQDAGVTDDLPYAREAARHLGVRLHEVRVDADRMASDIEAMVYQLDEPLADPAPLNVLYISRRARESGIKVLLSGAGGDDIFAGYRRHLALKMERYWSWMPRGGRAMLRSGTAAIGPHAGAIGRRLAKAFAYGDRDACHRLAGYFLWIHPDRLSSVFAAGVRRELGESLMNAPFDRYLATLPADMTPIQRMLALEQRFFLADHNLLYTDKMSMAAGVEVRVPLLDVDLVAAANAIDPALHLHGGDGKHVLKEAMKRYLPPQVIHRPKTGFGAPVRRWLRHDLSEWINDLFASATFRNRGIFDAAQVQRLVEDDRSGRIDAAYTVLGVACVELWCRRFVDGARQA